MVPLRQVPAGRLVDGSGAVWELELEHGIRMALGS